MCVSSPPPGQAFCVQRLFATFMRFIIISWRFLLKMHSSWLRLSVAAPPRWGRLGLRSLHAAPWGPIRTVSSAASASRKVVRSQAGGEPADPPHTGPGVFPLLKCVSSWCLEKPQNVSKFERFNRLITQCGQSCG